MTKKKICLITSLFLSLSVLAFFKYADFIINNLYLAFDRERNDSFDILLPVGISFFTFQTMSYTIDLYRGNIEPCHSLKKFMLFVAFFPQLVAGPIVRASNFLPQLNKKIRFNRDDILIGGQIFLGGAIQKVLFADNLSTFVDPVFSTPELYSTATLWLSLLSYALQIFCDFSGYSLMAIGIARTIGFRLPPNFNMPYLSRSVTELWTRWHISLSSWLKDYLYISLGGSRKGEVATYCNLCITMILGGLWHGASWNFVLWGAGHGFALAIHKFWAKHTCNLSIKNKAPYKLAAWSLTFITIALLWVPFRAENFSATRSFIHGLFMGNDGIFWASTKCCVLITLALFWHISYAIRWKPLLKFPSPSFNFVTGYIGISCILAALMAILLFSPRDTTPFIYFQF
ncbi:MBOAT family O-acyltransferase [Porticoccus sp. GXU_MW_L64]